MSQALICCSHSPVMLGAMEPADRQAEHEIRQGFENAGKWLREFSPDLIVMFVPDHLNGLFYDLMPSFIVGLDAEGTIDWDIEPGALRVPKDIALNCVEWIHEAGIDAAFSHRLTVDHGTTIPLNYLTGGLDIYPVLPIIINCVAPPLPSFKRTRLLGEAVGKFIAQLDARVIVLGSGGLSHDPPNLPISEVSEDAKEWMINHHDGTKEFLDRRQARVIEAAKQMAQGGGTRIPPDEEWDRKFLEMLLERDFAACDALNERTITKIAGHGGNEVRCWIAAVSAMNAIGEYTAEVDFYRAIPEWLTGMAMMRGHQ